MKNCVYIALHSVLYIVKNVLDKSRRESQNIHFWSIHFCSIFFPRKSWRLWDTVEKYGTPGHATDDIIRCMHFACRITKATDNTFRICNILCPSTTTLITRTRLNVTLPPRFLWKGKWHWSARDRIFYFLHIRD